MWSDRRTAKDQLKWPHAVSFHCWVSWCCAACAAITNRLPARPRPLFTLLVDRCQTSKASVCIQTLGEKLYMYIVLHVNFKRDSSLLTAKSLPFDKCFFFHHLHWNLFSFIFNCVIIKQRLMQKQIALTWYWCFSKASMYVRSVGFARL